MKTIKLGVLATFLSLTVIFSSCSSEEQVLSSEAPTSELLKSFKVKRDLSGAYSLDFDLKNDAVVDRIYDENTKTNQFYLYSSDQRSDRKVSEIVNLSDSKLKIGFVDTNTDETPSITITDDNIALAKGNSAELTSYEVTSHEDGSYQLDFTVAEDVRVDFVFNENIGAYEIHLEQGKGDESSYSRTFEKEAGQDLKIDFINHFSEYASKEALIRRPQIIIDGSGG
ncbi:MAG: hypothetical protein CMB99_06065 [Flavobacteriaceae bacterium]|nr:hypothetical protein [Flavobacteriaceae bacterium]|tara:strand:- start:15576 stop:16253 length:678 start_codon:yes stop_codon:yes gene_type:complete